MKAVLIKWLPFIVKTLLPTLLDMLLEVLEHMAHQPDNTINDETVGRLIANKDAIKETIKKKKSSL